jgi:uncharacterized protein YerC
MKVKLDKLSEKEITHTLDVLYTAAGAVQGRDQMKAFLRDLLTPSERIMLGRRIIIARKLIDGETYEDISSGMRVGQDTVWKVQKWLDDQMPGYEKAISGMKKEFNRRAEKKLYAKSVLFRLKKKYPLHFLLFPVPKSRNSSTLIYQSGRKVRD